MLISSVCLSEVILSTLNFNGPDITGLKSKKLGGGRKNIIRFLGCCSKKGEEGYLNLKNEVPNVKPPPQSGLNLFRAIKGHETYESTRRNNFGLVATLTAKYLSHLQTGPADDVKMLFLFSHIELLHLWKEFPRKEAQQEHKAWASRSDKDIRVLLRFSMA